TPERIFAIAAALTQGYTVATVHALSHIDPWFLEKMRHIVEVEQQLRHRSLQECPRTLLREAKQAGFADRQIGVLLGIPESDVRRQREVYDLWPAVKQVDTLAAEYPAQTNYL